MDQVGKIIFNLNISRQRDFTLHATRKIKLFYSMSTVLKKIILKVLLNGTEMMHIFNTKITSIIIKFLVLTVQYLLCARVCSITQDFQSENYYGITSECRNECVSHHFEFP